VLHWERVNPPWETPQLHWCTRAGPSRYTGLDRIRQYHRECGGGGPSYSASTGALSDGESEVTISDRDLPVSKVWWSDEVEHMLDKGLWWGLGLRGGVGRFLSRCDSITSFPMMTTDLPNSGTVDDVCANLSTLLRPPPRVLLPCQPGLWLVPTRQEDLSRHRGLR